MLNKSARYLANRLLRQQVISEEALDVYIYGFELLISFFFSTSVILLAGMIAGQIFETLAFLACFILLRSFTGGYHALTYWFCTVVTVSVFCAVLLLAHFLPVNILAYGAVFPLGLVILLLFSPVETQIRYIPNPRKKGIS